MLVLVTNCHWCEVRWTELMTPFFSLPYLANALTVDLRIDMDEGTDKRIGKVLLARYICVSGKRSIIIIDSRRSEAYLRDLSANIVYIKYVSSF